MFRVGGGFAFCGRSLHEGIIIEAVEGSTGLEGTRFPVTP